MLYAAVIGLFLPLVGFLILLFTSSFIPRRLTHVLACSTILISFLCFIGITWQYIATYEPYTVTLFRWLPVKGIHADFTLHLDSLSLLMALIITGVGFLIHVYSTGYMDHEEDFARYFACLNFFIFAMLLLVLAGNLLLFFVGWEGVGLASYLLIGYWYYRPAAAKAATKAFIVNRIGDLGLLLGLLLTFYLFETSHIADINQRASQRVMAGTPLITLLTLLYFWGATGKSAQLPLYTWLPDAMEGPTPVSALIHAATMVTAGVYLVVRMHPVFLLAPFTLYVIGIVGGATALFAAFCAVGQIDLKRVLAYSTISQLGLMFLACGVGGFYAAMFHLTTHAFIKALLFLSAGNVVHMMNGATNMEKMGGLAKKFPLTHWLFLIGVLGLSGVPPFAAFFSKDLILEEEYLAGYKSLFIVGLAASILTAFYLTRAYCLTFAGKPRLEDKYVRAIREAPRVMLLPLLVLAGLSIIGGCLGFACTNTPYLATFLAEQVGITRLEQELTIRFHITPEMWMAIAGAFLGIGSAALIYTRLNDRIGSTFALFKKAFYIDEIYQTLIVEPLKSLSNFIANFLEPHVFEGSIYASARATEGAAGGLQRMQSGQIRSYVAWMVLGMVVLVLYFIV